MAKTLKLKKPGKDAAAEGSEGAEGAAAPAARIQPPVYDRPASASYKFAGTLAILITIMFIALIAVQFMELNFFAAPTSVWPKAGIFGGLNF